LLKEVLAYDSLILEASPRTGQTSAESWEGLFSAQDRRIKSRSSRSDGLNFLHKDSFPIELWAGKIDFRFKLLRLLP